MMVRPLFDDINFLGSLAKGDTVAFKEAYERFNRKVYTVILKLLRSKVLAEEITQEVFLKLWRYDQQFNDLGHLEAWLRTTARTLSLNAFRRMALEKRLSEEAFRQFSESHNVTEEAILLNDAKKQLEAAIDKLPTQQREIYILCQQDGLRYEEVADRLGISVNTVKTHMKRALSSVRSSMKASIELAALIILLKLF